MSFSLCARDGAIMLRVKDVALNLGDAVSREIYFFANQFCRLDGLGVRQRSQTYIGKVSVHNVLPAAARLSFSCSAMPRDVLTVVVVASGETVEFEPSGRDQDFDFLVFVNYVEARETLVRGGCYRLCLDPEKGHCHQEGTVQVLPLSLPGRIRSLTLARHPGISFSFSASGWLFVYQLGVAECLQAHGLTRNPHVRVAGASGGALVAALMMYGVDLSSIKELAKTFSRAVYADIAKSVNLRSFLLEAIRTVVRDGSIQHPAFREGRVEIAVSESAVAGAVGKLKAIARGKNAAFTSRRVKEFNSSADAVIALLASCSMGISGLPFKYCNEEGREVEVADGAITDFLPAIDVFSIKIRPFSGPNLGSVDVAPTELVPPNLGLWPPEPSTIDHLFELGFQDMDAWLRANLEERLLQVRSGLAEPAADVPSVEFECMDNGMTWYDRVLEVVPVTEVSSATLGSLLSGSILRPKPESCPSTLAATNSESHDVDCLGASETRSDCGSVASIGRRSWYQRARARLHPHAPRYIVHSNASQGGR